MRAAQATGQPVSAVYHPGDDFVVVSVDPEKPHAGESVTIRASLKKGFDVPNWSEQLWFEIWIRQFGNWKIKSCYVSPCSLVWETASAGTFEYVIKHYTSSRDVSQQPAQGMYLVDVESTLPSGDTVPPKIVLSHSPQYGWVGQPITLSSLVSDDSGVKNVTLYVDEVPVKNCSQTVKISNCFVSLSTLSAGSHTFWATAMDTRGNENQSAKQYFVVKSS